MPHSSHPQTTRVFWWIKAFAIGSIYLGVGLCAAPFALYALPDIEARIWPVLTDQKITEVHLTPDGQRQLWVWEFNKNRRGIPEYVSFMAYSRKDPRHRYPVAVTVDWDCAKPFISSNSAARGNEMRKEMCALLPPALHGKTDVVIEGYFEYGVGNPFYMVPQYVPGEGEWP